jgi:hypothetical protein
MEPCDENLNPAVRSSSGTKWMLVAFGFITVLGVALVLLAANPKHRRPPTPAGLVFRVEARRVHDPLDRFAVTCEKRDGPAVVVFSAAKEDTPASLRVFRYPSGELLQELSGAPAEQSFQERSSPVEGTNVVFDFDADGVQDLIEVGESLEFGLIRVRSGVDRTPLFDDDDPLEYETGDRAIPLGDVDGDGYAELALLHPRMDRSRYDEELGDWLFGAKSWVTVVSGSRVER